ncbi:MAG: valine--tRNA ligase, partial [Actinomycetia bacterium]|nr:valine--tRNA ligase [Actinomycetes bacterium]
FEIGKRHNLEKINIFTEEAKVNENGGKYKGLTREEARRAVVKDLESEGLLEKTETHSLILGRCYRCDTLVEPYLSLQWFMSMKALAKPAIKAVEEKKVKFTPNNWEKIYFDWMHNIRDWCISRQIWWGHQIPVWYCNSCSEEIASTEVPKECPKCNSLELKQDENVLDTWFSSALWPFSTLGWPKKTDELRYFYPTNLLVTSHDIIFFWIARMIMMGLHFMDDVPFSEVYINALVRDVHGKKMSKSKGNVIDPMQIIDKYGTDALRLTLTALSVQGRDMFLSEERIEGYRNFCNKIWNASRFILMNLEEDIKSEAIEPSVETLFDEWIFSRYSKMCTDVRNSLDSYNFSKAVKSLYNFFWDDFCDWYIEISKMFIHKGSQEQKINSLKNLLYILDGFLRLIHPIMPFITEEIWQKLPHKGESIMISPYPKDEPDWINEEKEKQMEMVKNVIIDIRTIRSELSISPVRKIEVLLKVSKKSFASFYSQYQDFISQLVGAERIGIGVDIIKPSQSAVAVQEDVEIYLPLSGLINLHEEKARIENNIKDVDEELKKVEKKLGNKSFIQKAPENIVEKQRIKLETLEAKKEKLNNLLSFLKE